MLFRGSTKYSTNESLETRIYECGGEYNAYTDYDKTIYNIEKNTYSKIIDLTKNVNQIDKNNFFCDGIHKTIIGNQYVSEIIYKYLINNSKILSK